MRKLLIALFVVVSFTWSSRAQSFGLSGNYDATFESYGIGFIMGGDVAFASADFNFGDGFWSGSVGVDIPVSRWNNQGFYLGGGGTFYSFENVYDGNPYALYGTASYKLNSLVLSYSYGYLKSDLPVPSELNAYHRIRLSILLVSFY